MKPTQIPVTLLLVAVCVAVFGLMNLWNLEQILRGFYITIYMDRGLPEVTEGELWRLISPIFMHFGLFHIVFNMLWLYLLGGLLEIRQGKWLLLLLVLVSAVISNLGQFYFIGPYFGGMSGVIYALFGYVWIQGLVNAEFGVRLQPQIVNMMLIWFAICWSGVLNLVFGISIANSAHTAGLVSGIVLAVLLTLLFGRWQWPQRAR